MIIRSVSRSSRRPMEKVALVASHLLDESRYAEVAHGLGLWGAQRFEQLGQNRCGVDLRVTSAVMAVEVEAVAETG